MSDTSDSTASFDSTASISAYIVLFSTLLTLVLVGAKFLHDRPVLASFLPEAGMTLLVGMLAGGLLHLLMDEPDYNNNNNKSNNSNNNSNRNDNTVVVSLLSFSPQVFFIALLPPIIFNSGYHLRRELFLRHVLPVALFAVLGTIVSALTIAFVLWAVTHGGLAGNDFRPALTELLTFGALLSATDPVSTLAVFQAKKVDPQLFYLVFVESVLNDAVGLVLFSAFAHFVVRDNGAGKVALGMGEFCLEFALDAVGSPLLGTACGCGAALLFKWVDLRRTRLLELSIYVLIMYVPFLLANLLQLSGIVTILFTGMTAQAYAAPNLSPATAATADVLFRLAAHLAETAIFLELGLSVFGLHGSFHGRFLLWTILACLLARAANVYPIVVLFNGWLQSNPLNADEEQQISRMAVPHGDSLSRTRPSHVEMTEFSSSGEYHDPDRVSDDASTLRTTQTPTVRHDLRIHANTAHMLWFSGLRGAVAYACVRSFPDTFGHRREFILATMVMVLVTVFGLGGTTEIMLHRLHIPTNVDEDAYMHDWHEARHSSMWFLKFEDFARRYFVRQDLEELTSASGQKVIHRHDENDDDEDRHPSSYHSHGDDDDDENEHRGHGRLSNSVQSPGSPIRTAAVQGDTEKRPNSLFDYGGGDC
jgi:NhaP-type Na+/H+ or K+/H+ antiporter